MQRTGFAELRLCTGHIPMYREMVKLSGPLMEILASELGTKNLIERFSDPFWFQCYACAMGFEHNYTGATTVTLKAIKDSLENRDIGITVLGGKGSLSREAQKEIENLTWFTDKKITRLKRASRMSAKVDNSLVQDSFDVYFHSMLVDERGNFAVINQGMNEKDMLVRRYHWMNTKTFIEEPHTTIVSSPVAKAMDLTSRRSRETRKTIRDIIHDEPPEAIHKKFLLLDRSKGQTKIADFVETPNVSRVPYYLTFPRRLNLEALRTARECAETFEDIMDIRGIGKSTIRGLAYLSSLIYGTEISWKDPQRYCYTYGTKAGRPWYVERENMAESADILRTALEEARIGRKQKLNALRRLSKIFTNNHIKP